ncbi:MAG: hypothetical protein ACRYFX_13145 [Janthinobacterium lividum]
MKHLLLTLLLAVPHPTCFHLSYHITHIQATPHLVAEAESMGHHPC